MFALAGACGSGSAVGDRSLGPGRDGAADAADDTTLPEGDLTAPTLDAPTPAPDVASETIPGSGDARSDAAPDTASTAPDTPAERPPGEVAPACSPCADYAPATQVGRVTAAALDQLSGIAASRRNPGVLFVHNDHSSPEFWAVSEAGALLASFTYTGATVRDVEDIAVGPCPSGTCLFLADIGGNLAARPDYTIVRLPEPEVATNGSAAPVTIAAERLVFTYPDGAQHNAESLLIDPRGGTPYIIDKVATGAPSTAYRLPTTFGGPTAVATKIGVLPVPMAADQPATAADAHPCGTGFILRTGNTAYEFRIAAGAPFEDAFRATPVVVPVAPEQQGEGIGYEPDGRGFFTNSEGAMQPIHHTACR